MRYGCGCCGKPACDDEDCPGCVRWRREERGAPPPVETEDEEERDA